MFCKEKSQFDRSTEVKMAEKGGVKKNFFYPPLFLGFYFGCFGFGLIGGNFDAIPSH